MSNQVVTRTLKASITNHSQVRDDLDSHGFAASKLWNVGRWTISRVWDAIGYIPGADELCSYLKTHDRYADLHSQSSQRVLQELGEAFESWYEQDNPDANPPGYRKHGDDHPRSTVTWKNQGFKLDTKYNRVRLSKGTNMKESRYAADYILCEYRLQTDDGQTLDDVENVQTVRAVWTGQQWELHFVCKMRVETPETPGENTAGIDLGICNTAAVSVGDETLASLVAQAESAPAANRAGAIATVTGRGRTDDSPEETTIQDDLKARDGVHEVRLHHKTSVVDTGEGIVFVIVLAGHRREAFDALEAGLDRLEEEVPLFTSEGFILTDENPY